MTLLLLPESLEENSPCTNAQLDIKPFFCPKRSFYIKWHADPQVELQNKTGISFWFRKKIVKAEK